jgi:outer membrane protein OmpA-like peptidoglycan-associated protein
MLLNRSLLLTTTTIGLGLPVAAQSSPLAEAQTAVELAYLESPWRRCRRSNPLWTCLARGVRGELRGSTYEVPPPLPPPPPPPRCAAGPYFVFFDWDKDELAAGAAAILDNAAATYQVCGQAEVRLEGHTDRSGSDAYNVDLSQRRAQNVAQYLAGRGIPSAVITAEAFGESRPLVPTRDGVQEPQNRRVEITYGPGSGW